ncbi:DUF5007 domain-containing protein [Chitinophaga silvatica]|uniref:DUF5007 domain-containing protein n=1 Tax=Chitinophaga silvatica TaxID=2282649 RepID=A0A3E1YEW6_9BACT|nr:DUF5007 domain-containing protein [Chitinophaga silvatica]RFS25076.1 DUF5007 domain-containing protein [Chitinophaga silvatica]
MNKHVYRILIAGFISLVISGCYKQLLPGEKPYFNKDCNFSKSDFIVYPDRINSFISIFNPANSTQPMKVEITNATHEDGSPAPELFTQVDAAQWKDYYSGLEKSVAEIEAKRTTAKRPAFDVRATSGDIVYWPVDTAVVKPGNYVFDVVVSNDGGKKTFQKFKLHVRRPRPYEPWYFDDVTGERTKNGSNYNYPRPSLNNVQDDQNNNLKDEDAVIWYRWKSSATNTFSIKMFNKDSLPISLSKMNKTTWDSLKYFSVIANLNVPISFNRRFSEDSTVVTYDRTNPYPIMADLFGERSGITLAFERRFQGQRSISNIYVPLAFFRAGAWDVIVKFNKNIRFEND